MLNSILLLNDTVKGYVTVNSEDKITYISDELLEHWVVGNHKIQGKLLWDVFPLLLFNGFYEEVDHLRMTGCRKYNSISLPEINKRIEYSLAPAEKGGLLIHLNLPG